MVDVVKLLLDEMLAGLKEFFEALGYEVQTVQEAGLQGAKDGAITGYAKNNKLLLVTMDQKAAELADLMSVRNVYISSAVIVKVADEEIRKKYRDNVT